MQAHFDLIAAEAGEEKPYGEGSDTDPVGVKDPPAVTAPKNTSFHGTKRVNVDRLSVEAATIGDEIVKHLQGLMGADVEITIEIHAKVPDGVPDEVVRTVTENISTLRFDDGSGFEED